MYLGPVGDSYSFQALWRRRYLGGVFYRLSTVTSNRSESVPENYNYPPNRTINIRHSKGGGHGNNSILLAISGCDIYNSHRVYVKIFDEVYMEERVVVENKMGVMPVQKLLINMSAPMMISMLVQALYNIVDSIFVARVSEDALTAVSMAFPMQTLMVAIGAGMGVGVNAMLSKSLGEKKQEEADKAATNGMFLSLCSYILFLIIKGKFLFSWNK